MSTAYKQGIVSNKTLTKLSLSCYKSDGYGDLSPERSKDLQLSPKETAADQPLLIT